MEAAGVIDGPKGPPSGGDLKSPVLWMTQAQALAEAAEAVLRKEPTFDEMPLMLREMCDGQYCAVGLMLVGYSLEVALKAMLLVTKGVDEYTADEQKLRHHKLAQLADFIPSLSTKDIAILDCLTEFVIWAGRYPDPGTGKEKYLEQIFELAEGHEIAARDIFGLANRVMSHTQAVVG